MHPTIYIFTTYRFTLSVCSTTTLKHILPNSAYYKSFSTQKMACKRHDDSSPRPVMWNIKAKSILLAQVVHHSLILELASGHQIPHHPVLRQHLIDIRHSMAVLGQVHYHHAYRARNTAADALANHAMDTASSIKWLRENKQAHRPAYQHRTPIPVRRSP